MSQAPWLDALRDKLGEREVPGPDTNPWIAECFEKSGHPGIKDDTAWCAAAVGWALWAAGYPNTLALDARSYLRYGAKLDRPEPGCIVVFWRSSPTHWQGHVAFFVRDDGSHVRVLGGNQGNAVTEASYPKSQVLGYRMPVAPTAKALKDAGSSEIPAANMVQKAAVGGGAGAAVAEAVAKATPAAPSPPPDLLKQTAEQVSLSKQVMEGANAVAALVVQHRWLLLVGVCIAAYVGARIWKRSRVERAKAGQPVMAQAG
jgi:uncharacterized protein (TIGR02594 family)